MARNPGLRLPVLFLPFLLFTFCVQGSVAQQSAPALAQLTPDLGSTVAGEKLHSRQPIFGRRRACDECVDVEPGKHGPRSQGNLHIDDSSKNVIQVANMQSTAITVSGVAITPSRNRA